MIYLSDSPIARRGNTFVGPSWVLDEGTRILRDRTLAFMPPRVVLTDAEPVPIEPLPRVGATVNVRLPRSLGGK